MGLSVQNALFLFDSHSRNAYRFYDTSGHAIYLKFSSISYLNNYIKSFYENSTSISFVTQYDLQLISVEIMKNSKNQILTLARKKKALYNRVFSSKQNDSQSLLKKRKNQVHYQQSRDKILHNKKIYYTENKKSEIKRKIVTEILLMV